MQAIITKYISPTNHRGARIKAKCERGSITVPYDYDIGGLGSEAPFVAAADALRNKFVAEDIARHGDKSGGFLDQPFLTAQIPNGEYVHIFIPKGFKLPKS